MRYPYIPELAYTLEARAGPATVRVDIRLTGDLTQEIRVGEDPT